MVRAFGLILLLSFAALGGCVATPDATAQEEAFASRIASGPDTVVVATWNIEWLSAAPRGGHVKRASEDYARLAAYARRLNADIVALQEVAGPAAARRVFDPDEYVFFFEPGTHPQKTGFAVRKTVPVTDVRSYGALKLGRHGLRAGLALQAFVGGKAIRLLNVHMKSGCFERPLPTPQSPPEGSCETLAAQLPILEEWIDAQSARGMPAVVLGDFNRRLGKSGDAFWAELDDGEPWASDLEAATEGRLSECWDAKYPDFIDHIVFDQRSRFWAIPNTFEQLVFDEEDTQYEDVLSDHCPLSVSLRAPTIPID